MYRRSLFFLLYLTLSTFLHSADTNQSELDPETALQIEKANKAAEKALTDIEAQLKRTPLIQDTPRNRAFFAQVSSDSKKESAFIPQHIGTLYQWSHSYPRISARENYELLQKDTETTRFIPKNAKTSTQQESTFFHRNQDYKKRAALQKHLASKELYPSSDKGPSYTLETLVNAPPDAAIWIETVPDTAREPLTVEEKALLRGNVYEEHKVPQTRPIDRCTNEELRNIINTELKALPAPVITLIQRHTTPKLRKSLEDSSEVIPRADIDTFIKNVSDSGYEAVIPTKIQELVKQPQATNTVLKRVNIEPSENAADFSYYIANEPAIAHSRDEELVQKKQNGPILRRLENGKLVHANKKGLTVATYPRLLPRLGVLGADVTLHGKVHQSFRARRIEYSINALLKEADKVHAVLKSPEEYQVNKEFSKIFRMVSFNPLKAISRGHLLKAMLTSEGVRLAKRQLVGTTFTRQAIKDAPAIFFQNPNHLPNYHITGKPIPVEPFIDWAISGRLTGWKPLEAFFGILVDDTFDETLPQQLARKLILPLGKVYGSQWFQLFRRFLIMQLTLRYLDGSYVKKLTKVLLKERKQICKLLKRYSNGDTQTKIQIKQHLAQFIKKQSNLTGISIAGWLTRLVRLRGVSQVITDAQAFYAHHIKAALAINALLFVPRFAMLYLQSLRMSYTLMKGLMQ